MAEKSLQEKRRMYLVHARENFHEGLKHLKLAREIGNENALDEYIDALSYFSGASKDAKSVGSDKLAKRFEDRFLRVFGEGWDKQERYLAFSVEAIIDGFDFAENYLGIENARKIDFDVFLNNLGYANKTVFEVTGKPAFSREHIAMRGRRLPYISR